MKRHAVLGSCLALALGTAACQDQLTQAAPGTVRASLAGEETLDRSALRLPGSGRASAHLFEGAPSEVINPADYVCVSGSPVSSWYSSAVVNTFRNERPIYTTLYNSAADLVPTYEALYFQSSDTEQYFGYDGRFTQVIKKAERDNKRFWDIQSSDIQVVGMHGNMLLDTARTARTYRFVFGLSSAAATFYANQVRAAVLASSTVNGGNHPWFSFNAFAFTTYGASVPDKIVMGDGILEGYDAIGFGDVAPQAIFAHEFGHHIQFENGYFDDPETKVGPAESARYTELMADAFSAYYLTHARGQAMNRKRVEQFLEVFFQIGDCGFSSSGHHGTPNQRKKAAQFGFGVADQAQKQGHILTAAQFHALFVAEYARIVAPDAR